jgi:Fe(3+) dicitrate transport protein
MKYLLTIFTMILLLPIVYSQNEGDSILNFELPQIDIIGRNTDIINRIPGSIFIIKEEELKLINPSSGNEILRKVAGLNVIDEEGMGLRMNLGIRGMDPDRSRSVLVLEDGIPVSLAPYGEPELYYSPPIERMSGVEVVKGSGSILFGPQTLTGIVNYLTPDPPKQKTTSIRVSGGENGIFFGKIGFGTSYKNVGLQLNAFRKQGDNVGVLRYRITDLNAKIKLAAGTNSTFGLKLGVYNENSNSTYVGITQIMYNNGEYFPVMPNNDNLDVKRYTATLSHDLKLNNDLTLVTTAYGYTTERAWRRQDFSRTTAGNTTEVWGDTNVTGGAIFMRSTNSTQDRRFLVGGVEPRLFYAYRIGKIKNELDLGIRYHWEKAFEKRYNGSNPDAESGALVTDEIRTGNAFSGYLQNRFFVTEKLTVTPGIRYELFKFNRHILRNNSRDTNITAESDNSQFIPGIGVSYFLNNKYNFFAGIHRGYAPPRIKDAININAQVTQLDAELSWNTEAGLRANLTNSFYTELTGYYLDFTNQVVPVSVSSGGTGSGLVNGGKTVHYGIEGAFSIDFGKFLRSKYNIILSSNLTLGKAFFNADRYITEIKGQDTSVINVKNNKLPYAPDIVLNASVEFRSPFGAQFIISGNYTSKQFTDELNTIDPSNDGLRGEIDPRLIIDITARYDVKRINTGFFVSVKNLTDVIYIAGRRPQGIKTGTPRIVTAGFELNF